MDKKWHAVYGIYKTWGSTFYISVLYCTTCTESARTVKYSNTSTINVRSKKIALFHLPIFEALCNNTIHSKMSYISTLHSTIQFPAALSTRRERERVAKLFT